MRMQKRMLRSQMRMFIAKIVTMLCLAIVYIANPFSQLGDIALLIVMSMLFVFLVETTRDLGDSKG